MDHTVRSPVVENTAEEHFSFPAAPITAAPEAMDVDGEDECATDNETSESENAQEHTDGVRPDMQQFDAPVQYQQFRRKSIIPVDETVRTQEEYERRKAEGLMHCVE